MRRELKYTLRLSEHLKEITSRHFEIQNPYWSQNDDPNDQATHRAYVRDILIDGPSYVDLTDDQKYLHDLGGVITPILSAYRTRNRIPRLKPRTGRVGASSRLEECGQRLGMEAFHFKERIRLFADSAIRITHSPQACSKFNLEIASLLRKYTKTNDRLLRYRNFVVHGPKKRIDEFAELRGWELNGIFFHDDLWLEYNNVFETSREEWTSIAKTLVGSIESAVARIQLLSENNILTASFRFARPKC
jgi:hypothetical protein